LDVLSARDGNQSSPGEVDPLLRVQEDSDPKLSRERKIVGAVPDLAAGIRRLLLAEQDLEAV
jgi:hypothetical protein